MTVEDAMKLDQSLYNEPSPLSEANWNLLNDVWRTFYQKKMFKALKRSFIRYKDKL